jgi:HEPN domain-containing protein
MMQRPDPGSAHSAHDWLTHATSDLKLAQIAKESSDVLAEQICFHAQQAVEKSLKAVLLHKQIDFPLIHDLEELLELATGGGITIPPEMSEVGTLTPYAVEIRYPGHAEDITPLDVDEALRLAATVVHWATNTLGAP